MSKKPIIELEGISAAYEKNTVLYDVNLTVYERDFLGIIGPNGGGKTTLIKIILGLMKQASGRIRFYEDGTQTDRLIMGYLPQYNSIDRKFPISVEEVILSGLSARKTLASRFTKQHKEKVDEVIVQMGLEGLAKRSIGQLSGGQLQRALLGRAIISGPQVVILDEPSTYIDQLFEARLYELLEEINKECAIILVSHDIGTILQHAKSIVSVNETVSLYKG
ncbi:metal ABC transporter ATP-binding protein [Bacteroides sp. 519]|nr:metal ABC transporter ATP-binding protein [Bacteroides sp. 519]NDV57590.1 metal ABC transporter ATP-binding protein [Bacteroides sp. 519]